MQPPERPRLERFQPTQREPGWHLHPALREPLRLATLAAAAILIAGAISDWVDTFIPGRGWLAQSGFVRANDGGILLELGLGIVAITLSERAWHARLAILVVAPFFLGVVAVVDLVVAYLAAVGYLENELRNAGGHGVILPGLWLAVAGGILSAVAGGIRVWRARRTTRWTIGVGRSVVGASIGGVVGAAAGFVLGVAFGQHLASGPTGSLASSAIVAFAIGFGFAGAWFGAATGSYLASVTQRT